MSKTSDAFNNAVPRISSENPEERKAARALRIQKRQEALKKAELLSKGREADWENEESAACEEENISCVDQQVAVSAALLEHLLADGEERVTNIRVASDAREVARRFFEADKKKEILSKLEAEAALAQEKFNKISANWNLILDLNDPLSIERDLNLQRERCADLMKQKDSIIDELKCELEKAHETFYQDLQKQLNDIKQLGERIDKQVMLMRDAYRTQMCVIESAVEAERSNIVQHNERQWNQLYKERDKQEVAAIEKKILQYSEFQNKMDNLSVEHREKYRAAKIQLSTEIQTLQCELQQLKAICLINSEKIDYNYQVLKKREEENVFVRSQQKRRLNKMQDIINELRNKINIAQQEGRAEELKANKEVCKMREAMSDLQRKADHFTQVNEKKYQQVWLMNKEKADELLRKIILTDKLIHEQILGLAWKQPEVTHLHQSELASYKAMQNNLKKLENASSRSIQSETSTELQSSEEKIFSLQRNPLVSRILMLIADSSGFLIEDRLWPLLEKYEEEPVILCKLDNIFNALEVKNYDDIQLLCAYFIKYAFCPECSKKGGEHTKDISSEEIMDSVTEEASSEVWFYDENESSELEEYPKLSKRVSRGFTTLCKRKHPLKIAPTHTFEALQEFVASSKRTDPCNASEEGKSTITPVSRYLKPDDVALYWKQNYSAFSDRDEKLWDGLLFGLNKYLPILQDRKKLNEEVVQLRKQNVELQHLLKGQIPKSGISKRQRQLTPLCDQYKPNVSRL